MICPKCNAETPVNKAFCVKCGGFIDVSSGDAMKAVRGEVMKEARAALIRKMGVWLATAVVLLAGAITFRLGNREADLPRFDEAPILQMLDYEPEAPLPVIEIPILELEVPAPDPAPAPATPP